MQFIIKSVKLHLESLPRSYLTHQLSWPFLHLKYELYLILQVNDCTNWKSLDFEILLNQIKAYFYIQGLSGQTVILQINIID